MSHRHANEASSRRGGRRFLGIELVDEDPPNPDDRPRDPTGPPAGGGPPGGGPDGPDGPDLAEVDEPKPKKPLWRRLVKWMSLGLVMLILAAVGTFFVAYAMIDIPDPNDDFTTETTEVYYSDGETLLGTFAIQNREEVELAAVPDPVQAAVISAEDRTFWENSGIDFRGIVRAAWSNVNSGEVTQGASTITQQYVKVYYLSQDRTWARKFKEAILSLKVQRQLSKQEVLQGYLNTIYFGRGAYGIQAAAQAYFLKDVEDLNVAQGAVLAAILNSPSGLDPANGKESQQALLGRYQYVLDGMVEMGELDADRAARIGKELPKFPKIEETNVFGGQRGHLMNMVEADLLKAGFSEEDIYGGGLRVTTTFDLKMQRAAQQAVKEQKNAIKEYGGKYKQLHVSLASVQPGNGAVKALYAGHNYLSDVKNAQYNWATQGGVQPGSSFKPFALAAALKKDYSLDDTFDGSSPYYLDATGEDVENQGDSGGGSFGYVSLLYATEHSVNTAFVDLTLDMGDGDIEEGAGKILEAAEAAGVGKEWIDNYDPVAVTSLGYEGVPTIDMADAYATFAAEGQQADWFTVETVTDSGDGEMYTHPDKPEQAFSKKVAADVSYALESVIDVPGATGNDAAIDCPAAGKTGTATGPQGEVSSSWFVGYTPRLATAVTYSRGDGNNQLEGYLPSFYGGDYPAATWQAYMSDALEGKECIEFPDPVEDEPEYTEPTETEPTETEPTETEPTETEPTETEPTETEPTNTEPTETTPTTSEPTEPTEPTQPTCTPPLCDDGPGGPDGDSDASGRQLASRDPTD